MKQKTENKGYSLKYLPNGSVKVSVFVGKNAKGTSILKSKTWKPSPDLTPKKNEQDLLRFAIDFRDKVKEGKILKGESLKFKDFIPKWLETYVKQNLKETTYDCYKTIVDNHLINYLGEIKLIDINPYMIADYYATLSKQNYKKSTLHKIHAVLSSAMKTAKAWGIININPCLNAELPKIDFEVDKDKCFNISQAQRFISMLNGKFPTKSGYMTNLPYQMQVLFLTALLGGLRKGEILALTWKDVDFINNKLSISKSVYRKNGETLIKEPKNKRSNRIISISPEVVSALNTLRTERKETCLKLGITWNDKNYIFIQENGSIMHPSTPRHTLEKFLYGCNEVIENEEDKFPLITFHGLRHTHATISILLGNDLGSISGRIGHANTNTTLKIYSHFLEEGDEKVSDSIGNELFYSENEKS